MKKIFSYIKEHIKEDFQLSLYVYTAIFLLISFIINYTYDFEDSIIDKDFGKPAGILWYILFYMFAYYGIAIPMILLKKKTSVLRNKEFWLKSLLFVGMIGLMAGFYQYRSLTASIENPYEAFFLKKILMNLKRFVPYIIILYIVKKLFDKEIPGIYGLKFRGFSYGPYFFLLLLVSPLIVWASFQPDFLSVYPRGKFWDYPEIYGMGKYTVTGLFEIAYGLDFVCVELIFRGALVIGMASVLGRGSILPMAVIYAYLHFGKPMGEAISSIFGGYILGIIAYNSRNIMGGVIVHLGVAYLMEITAFIQYYAKM